MELRSLYLCAKFPWNYKAYKSLTSWLMLSLPIGWFHFWLHMKVSLLVVSSHSANCHSNLSFPCLKYPQFLSGDVTSFCIKSLPKYFSLCMPSLVTIGQPVWAPDRFCVLRAIFGRVILLPVMWYHFLLAWFIPCVFLYLCYKFHKGQSYGWPVTVSLPVLQCHFL